MSKATRRVEILSQHLKERRSDLESIPTHGTKETPKAPTEEQENYADEYGEMDSSGLTHTIGEFILESGVVLKNAPVRFNTWGTLNASRDNVLVVCHALTGNSKLDTWWGELLGPGRPFDTSKYLVVCCNILGSCYGTAGPATINPETGKRYGGTFPKVTVRDTVSIHIRTLKEALGVVSIASVIGGSLGGMQALEWAFLGQEFVRSAIAIACGGRHHAWQIGISEVQRRAIYADPNWKDGNFDPASPPSVGLALARQIAMISYRTHTSFESKFGRKIQKNAFAVGNYLHYQGEKFLKRFDANSYDIVTKMMDTHDVARGRGEYFAVLKSLSSPILVIGVDSDVLYPIEEQKELANHLGNCEFRLVTSVEGHDGFLLEQEQIGSAISSFLARVK